MPCCGRAIAQAVSNRLPTAAARVRAQVRSYGICGGQSGTGTGFLWVLRFPLPILILPIASHSSSSGDGTVGQLVVDVPSGLKSHPTPRNLKKLRCCNAVGARIVLLIHGKGNAVSVRNWLTTTPWRRMGEWKYRSMYPWPRQWFEVSGQFHAPAALPPGKISPCTYWIGCWVGPRTSLDDVERRKILAPTVLKLRSHGRPTRN
jgi:hypothetical protein